MMLGLLLCGACLAGNLPSSDTLLRMGPMPLDAEIDGVISQDETGATSAHYGLVSDRTGLLSGRFCNVYFGWTARGLYLATRTAAPRSPQRYTAEDAVTLVLQPPKADHPFAFRVRLDQGENQLPKGCRAAVREVPNPIQNFGDYCSEMELFVPYSAMSLHGAPKDGERWGMQIKVDFSSERETALWHKSEVEGELATFIPDRAAPIPTFFGFGPFEAWRDTGYLRMEVGFRNVSGRAVTLSAGDSHFRKGIQRSGDPKDGPQEFWRQDIRDMDGVTLAPREQKTFLRIFWEVFKGDRNILRFDISGNGKPLYKRTIYWNFADVLVWKDGEGLPSVKAAFYPTFRNRLKARYDNGKMADIVAGAIALVGPDGSRRILKEFKGGGACIPQTGDFEGKLGDLPLGDYKVVYAAKNSVGRKFKDQATFSVRKFPWQGLELGKDDVVIPPFKPLAVSNALTKATLTGYNTSGPLWDAVYSKGENILAAPAVFELDGQGFTEAESKIVSAKDTRVVREIKGRLGGVDAVVTQDYDYDGFCLVTLRLLPKSVRKLSSLRLRVPLKGSVCSLLDVIYRGRGRHEASPDLSLPKGEGEVWNSGGHKMPMFPASIQPYVFMGGPEKGFCWLVDSWVDWSLDAEKPAERIVRHGPVATLEADFVNKETEWDATEKTYIMGFQATPVKPVTTDYMAWGEKMHAYQRPTNSVPHMFSCKEGRLVNMYFGENAYPAGDKTFFNWVRTAPRDEKLYQRRLREYVDRHARWFEETLGASKEEYLYFERRDNPMGNSAWMYYLNPTLVSCFWPEWEMYKSEWMTCEWPVDNAAMDYGGSISRSRIDKMLFDHYVAIKDGFSGTYYDNFSARHEMCPIAYPLACKPLQDGSPRYSLCNLMAWRELAKRTAVMCYMNGATYGGVPSVEIHDTCGLVVPVASWLSTVLHQECSKHAGEYQDRFPESFVLADITGRQAGAATRILVNTIGGDEAKCEKELRSLLSYCCAYGFFTFMDQGLLYRPWFDKAWNVVMDYGWGRQGTTIHHFYNDEGLPVTHTGKNVRLTVAEKKGKGALLLFGNLDEAEDVSFDVAGLGLGPNVRFRDAMTDEILPKSAFHIDRRGYRLIFVEQDKH